MLVDHRVVAGTRGGEATLSFDCGTDANDSQSARAEITLENETGLATNRQRWRREDGRPRLPASRTIMATACEAGRLAGALLVSSSCGELALANGARVLYHSIRIYGLSAAGRNLSSEGSMATHGDATLLEDMTLLADPVRSRVLLLLEVQELTVGQLCSVLQLPQSTVSRHLKALADRDWITSRADGTQRPYSATLDSVSEVSVQSLGPDAPGSVEHEISAR